MSGTVFTTPFVDFSRSLPPLLDATNLREKVAHQETILIKPNLVEPLEPPITTPVSLVAELIDYLRHHCPQTTIVIGEGSGSPEHSTFDVFQALGYTALAIDLSIDLLDLNEMACRKKSRPDCSRFPELYLPTLLDDVFILSVPVLKAHSMSDVTLTLKNMIGCAPPAHYQEGGYWRKSAFHTDIHRAIFELNQYRSADFTLLDATVGMAEAHLWGPTCNPPVNRLAASWDPVAIDSYGATLLGRNWQDIDHIRYSHDILGMAEPLMLVEVPEA